MKHKEMIALIDRILDTVKTMHTEGQKEYAMNKDNVFANFQRIANQTGNAQEMVLWIYLMKHIDGIASYIKGHVSQRENVKGRLTDAIVYLCILWGMIESKEKMEALNRQQAEDMLKQGLQKKIKEVNNGTSYIENSL